MWSEVGQIMCGHYYVDDETAREIEKIVRKIDGKLHGTDGFRVNECGKTLAQHGHLGDWVCMIH